MPVALLQAAVPSSNLSFLFAAFAISWAAFFLYAFFLTRRQKEMQQEIRALRQALEQDEPEGE